MNKSGRFCRPRRHPTRFFFNPYRLCGQPLLPFNKDFTALIRRVSCADWSNDFLHALQDFDLLCDRIMAHMMSGVSTRKYDPLLDEITSSTGLKKSSASKAFIMGSQQCLDNLNSRDLSKHNFFSIMIDGLEVGRRTIIVAMGIKRLREKNYRYFELVIYLSMF